MKGADVTSVVVADDHAVVRRGLQALFAGQADLDVVGETADVPSTFTAMRELTPDVLLLDLHMDGVSSLRDIGSLLEASPGTRIVVLTMQTDPVFAREALFAGAVAFVTKQASDEDVLTAVRAAAAGESWLDPTVGAGAVTGAPPSDLSPRETEVLRLIALGHTNPEIAAELHLSLRTVETHRAHIQQKVGASRRADLVRYALDHELVRP